MTGTPAPPTDATPPAVLLIVDDEPEIRDVLDRIAKRACPGLEIVTAEDVPSAEAVLRARNVYALLTDLRMPGTSGLELLRAQATRAPQMRRALMTGYVEDIIDGVALDGIGLVGVLRKPFGAVEARDFLRKLAAQT